MKVTIIADASHCKDTNAAGYGFWAVSPRGRCPGEGSFGMTLPDATIAEMLAIVHALRAALRLGIAQTGDEVLFQSDCIAAIRMLSGPFSSKRKDFIDACIAFAILVKERQLTPHLVHVKGHTRGEASRFVAQRLSDRRARAGMRRARDWINVHGTMPLGGFEAAPLWSPEQAVAPREILRPTPEPDGVEMIKGVEVRVRTIGATEGKDLPW